jgi:DNA-nicking Smr family endonuclease
MSGGGRRLRDDEHELWKGVTRSIKPLRPRAGADSVSAEAAPKAGKALTRPRAAAPVAQVQSKPVPPPAPAPLGRRMKQRLARGIEGIDARLDLHGRTQAQAHAALLNFLRTAQARGDRNLLIITGKGTRQFAGERGVLKRQVPMWLQLPEFRALIVGFEEAHAGHGGEGALYVRLRKLRE